MTPTIAHTARIVLCRGGFALLFGISMLAWPEIPSGTLLVLSGAYAVVDGIAALAVGFGRGIRTTPWFEMVLAGNLSVLAGLAMLAWPANGGMGMLGLLAGWCAARGIADILAAIRLRDWDGDVVLILAGIGSIFSGALLAVTSRADDPVVVRVIGTYAACYGAVTIAITCRLRSLKSIHGHHRFNRLWLDPTHTRSVVRHATGTINRFTGRSQGWLD
jgi:uncharacterized membrane protein HdeD (DUF308 family)